MPIWAPVKLMAGWPRDWMAMAMRAMEICSPVAKSMSISRAGGCSLISRAREISSSVVSPRALTTTMTWLPACLARMARRAARVMRSAVATLLPPNFWTTRGTEGRLLGNALIREGEAPAEAVGQARQEPRPPYRETNDRLLQGMICARAGGVQARETPIKAPLEPGCAAP